MAVITPVRSSATLGASVITWANVETGDTATESLISGQSGAIGTIQVQGTFGGATISLQGSNDGINFSNITDAAGNAVTLSAAGLREFSTAAPYLRPGVSGGTGMKVTVTLVVRG